MVLNTIRHRIFRGKNGKITADLRIFFKNIQKEIELGLTTPLGLHHLTHHIGDDLSTDTVVVLLV